jgi:16S rRNA (guanine1207-N2)-methyltransferase
MDTQRHLSTQILERNLDHLQQKLLVINPPELETVTTLCRAVPKEKIFVSCQDYGVYTQVHQLHIPAAFEAVHKNKIKFDQAIVFLPKSDAEIEMTLLWATHTLKTHGELVLIGQNDAGIKSAKKTLVRLVGEITYADNARHSGFFIAKKTVSNHAFNLDDWWEEYDIETPTTTEVGKKLTIFSLPGVFSHGRLDEGTGLLLDSLKTQPVPGTTMLDWGCGAGAIGAYLGSSQKTIRVDMADSNALALEATKKTIMVNGLQNCNALTSETFSEIDTLYDAIIANPPFHKGHDTHYSATEAFLKEASRHLQEHGHLRIVANVFLRYEPILEEYFGYVKTVNKNTKYKVLEAVKTPTPRADKRKKLKKDKRINIREELEELA